MKPDGLGECHWTELDPITKWLCVFPSCTNYGITSFSGINQSPSCDMRRASLHLITKINSLAALDVWAPFEWLLLPQSALLLPLLFWSHFKAIHVISSELRHTWRWNRPRECYLIEDLWTLIEEDLRVWIRESGETEGGGQESRRRVR